MFPTTTTTTRHLLLLLLLLRAMDASLTLGCRATALLYAPNVSAADHFPHLRFFHIVVRFVHYNPPSRHVSRELFATAAAEAVPFRFTRLARTSLSIYLPCTMTRLRDAPTGPFSSPPLSFFRPSDTFPAAPRRHVSRIGNEHGPSWARYIWTDEAAVARVLLTGLVYDGGGVRVLSLRGSGLYRLCGTGAGRRST